MSLRHHRRAALLAVVATIVGCALAPGALAARSEPNDFGIRVVRFTPGTSPAAMRQAIARAGGQVVTDLSPIGAMAVASPRSGLMGRLRGESGVRAVWTDRVTARPSALAPDPLHDVDAFGGENAPGVLQWEDDRDGVRQAWATTTGAGAKVAVLDTGVEPSHREIQRNLILNKTTIPCDELKEILGPGSDIPPDCGRDDTEGHGTWVASRIVGDDNGFASNGVAPDAKLMAYKVLATGVGGLSTWIVDAMLQACDADTDIINMSLGGYDDPADPAGADDYFLWLDAVDYCRAKGTAVVAAAGNEHVRNLRQDITLAGSEETRTVRGAGVVADTGEGIGAVPGDTELTPGVNDFRGLLNAPGGVPGVIMVSASGNTVADPAGNVLPAHAPPPAVVGTQDNLTYYSSYGERVDLSAPGGARKYSVPVYDAAPGTDVLLGGWGQLGATVKDGELCRDTGDVATFACFVLKGDGFAWLQGTSMSSPQVAGVAALAVAAHPELRDHPDALQARLVATTRTDMVNHVGPTSPAADPAFDGTPCAVGFCHVSWDAPVPFGLAYGAGMVNAAAAVAAG
jgi:subtilisin family serine protease